MKKFHHAGLSFFLMALIIASLACGVSTAPVPTSQLVVPTSQSPAVPTAEPTVNQPVYAKAQIGSYLSIWVTYDPELWDAPKWLDGTNQAGEQVQQLTHKNFSGCSLHDNLGHGVPTNWSFGSYTKELGNIIFQIDQWTDSTTNNPVMVIYQYPAGGQTDTTRRIELETGTAPYDCVTAAESVVSLSAADIMK